MKTPYKEPREYIPEDIRKELKIGEYAEDNKKEKEPKKKDELKDIIKGKK